MNTIKIHKYMAREKFIWLRFVNLQNEVDLRKLSWKKEAPLFFLFLMNDLPLVKYLTPGSLENETLDPKHGKLAVDKPLSIRPLVTFFRSTTRELSSERRSQIKSLF